MIFNQTVLRGAYTIELEPRTDDRGFFARLFCQREFRQRGLACDWVQVNNSVSKDAGTLRGLHYQLAPRAETKLVRCVAGSAWDLILDLRPDSPTFGQSYGAELSAKNRQMMYVPKGFAHGILTLAPFTELIYFVDAFYSPDDERGIRWNDPRFGFEWPVTPFFVSEKDQAWPDFDRVYHLPS
jgi:dTDP-4-dehydrorhamnose 3,5-epimerase